MRRFRRTPGRSGWQTSRVGIKSGATGLDDEPVRRPRLLRRDDLSGLPLLDRGRSRTTIWSTTMSAALPFRHA
jgi:hypothetical protein